MKKRYFEGTDQDSGDGSFKIKKKINKESASDISQSQDTTSQGGADRTKIHQRIHDLSNFEPGHFRPSKKFNFKSHKVREKTETQRIHFREVGMLTALHCYSVFIIMKV